jgi:hypothetical protein
MRTRHKWLMKRYRPVQVLKFREHVYVKRLMKFDRWARDGAQPGNCIRADWKGLPGLFV